MNLIDKQNAVRLTLKFSQQGFEAFFEVTTVFSASQKRTHIQAVYHSILDNVRYFLIDNTLGQTFYNGRFTHAGITNQQWVVFAAAGKGLHQTVHFVFAPDQRVNFAFAGHAVEIGCITFERTLIATLGLITGFFTHVVR